MLTDSIINLCVDIFLYTTIAFSPEHYKCGYCTFLFAAPVAQMTKPTGITLVGQLGKSGQR